MLQALTGATAIFLLDIPWFVLCCVPFIPLRKIERRTMAWRILLVSILCFLIVFCGLLLTKGNPLRLVNTIRLLMYLPMLGMFFRSFKVGWWKILYVFFFEQAVATEVNLLAYLSTISIFHKATSLTESLWVPLNAWLILLVIYPILWLFFQRRLRPAMQLLTERQVRNLCAVPFLFFILCILYGNLSKYIGLNFVHNALFSLFFSFVGVAAYVVTLVNTVNIVESSRREMSLLAMEQQLEGQSQRFDQLNQSIEQARSARHDLRHHLAVIQKYVEMADVAGLKNYLEEYLSHLPQDKELPVCQNFAVDVLLRNYLSQAKQAGAEVDVKIGLPRQVAIPDSQLCIVFGNIFENAVHACQQQTTGKKFVRVRCITEQEQLILTVDNSTDQPPPVTPGIGLSSVKAVVEKYRGTLTYQVTDGVFQTSVMMFIPQIRSRDERGAETKNNETLTT